MQEYVLVGVVGETPGISIGDIAKTIGEMWRGLSDADKKPYQVLFFGLM